MKKFISFLLFLILVSCSTNETSELQNNDETAEIEINISNIVKTIENYQYFFSPIQSTCPISYKELNKNILKDCNTVKDNKNLILMEILIYCFI